MNKLWTLEIFDQDGNLSATAWQVPNQPANIHGDMVLLAEALPGVTSLTRFFTDPDAKAKAAYDTFSEGMVHSYGLIIPTWETIKSNPEKQHLVTIWKNIAKASSATDCTLN